MKKPKIEKCDRTVVEEESTYQCPYMVTPKKSKITLGKASVVVTILVGVFTLLGFTVGGYSFLDQRYALATNFAVLEKRVGVNELKHLYHSSLDNVYFFRKQIRINPDDPEIQAKLDEAVKERDGIKERLNDLMSK